MPAGGKGARGREGGRLCLFPRPLQSPPRAHVRLLVALEGFSPAARWLRIVRRYCRAYWHSHFRAALVLRIKPRLNHEKKVMTSPARRPHLAFKHMQSEDGGAPSGCARPDVCTCPPRRVWQSPQPFPSPPPPATKQEETALPLSKPRGRRGSLVAQARQELPPKPPGPSVSTSTCAEVCSSCSFAPRAAPRVKGAKFTISRLKTVKAKQDFAT